MKNSKRSVSVGVPLGRPCERRDLDRVVVHDRGLDQLRLDEVTECLVDQLRPVPVALGIDTPLGQPRTELDLVARPQLLRFERLREANSLPGSLQVEVMTTELHLARADHLSGNGLDERFDPHHRVPVVGVRLVPLEHRELGIVLERNTLVSEVLADLVDPLETTDDQPLQVELRRNSEVEVAPQLVVMGHERTRRGSPVERLQHGSLDLEEPVAVEDGSHRGDDARAKDEIRARLLVDEQIEIALAVAKLDVGQPVERVGKRLGVA